MRAHGGLHRSADFAGESDLAEHRRVWINCQVLETRNNRGHDTEIGRRLIDFKPAGDVHEHIVAGELQSGALILNTNPICPSVATHSSVKWGEEHRAQRSYARFC